MSGQNEVIPTSSMNGQLQSGRNLEIKAPFQSTSPVPVQPNYVQPTPSALASTHLPTQARVQVQSSSPLAPRLSPSLAPQMKVAPKVMVNSNHGVEHAPQPTMIRQKVVAPSSEKVAKVATVLKNKVVMHKTNFQGKKPTTQMKGKKVRLPGKKRTSWKTKPIKNANKIKKSAKPLVVSNHKQSLGTTKTASVKKKVQVKKALPLSKPSSTVAKTYWTVHVGSFLDQHRVQSLLKSLRAKGYQPLSERISTPHGVLSRVSVGHETNPAKLANMAKKIGQQLKIATKVTKE
jgi:cell division septation protein DedD